MKMTKNVALTTALSFVPETETEVREILTNMVAQLSKPRKTSEEAKAKRKEQNAKARMELVSQVAPILRKYLSQPMTAKELFEVAQSELPEGFTPNKVQAMLLREMKEELVKTETKGKANTYCLAE